MARAARPRKAAKSGTTRIVDGEAVESRQPRMLTCIVRVGCRSGRDVEVDDEGRDADRWRRLSGTQRGAARRGAQGPDPLRRRAARVSATAGRASSRTGRRARRRAHARHAASRRHGPRLVTHQPVQGRRWCRPREGDAGEEQRRRVDRHRRRGHARRGQQVVRRGRQRRRRAEDDRQRPLCDRVDVRVQHCGADLRRRHRPAAHHGGVTRSSHGGRGHGTHMPATSPCGPASAAER